VGAQRLQRGARVEGRGALAVVATRCAQQETISPCAGAQALTQVPDAHGRAALLTLEGARIGVAYAPRSLRDDLA
jgi:hypothetical protein